MIAVVVVVVVVVVVQRGYSTLICNGDRAEWSPIRSVDIQEIKKIKRPRRGHNYWMLLCQWRWYFFLNFVVKSARLLARDWSSGCLATVYAIEKLFFCNSGLSFRDSWQGIYQRIKGQERKWKHEELHGVLEERFQKVDQWKKLPSKFRRVVRSDEGLTLETSAF